MCQLFETIRIEGGEPQNLALHEIRLNNSRRSLFGCDDIIMLKDLIAPPFTSNTNIFRCRINYSKSINSIEYTNYQPAIIKSLRLITADSIDYGYKYADRSALTALIDKSVADDILIVKNGLVTDTSYANIVFTDGIGWYTPISPLLRGTMREKLLSEGIISEAIIAPDQLGSFLHFRLINAMLGFNAPLIPVSGIIL